MTLFAEIDGRPVPHLQQYRTESEVFTVGPVPANNLLQIAEGREVLSVDDGYYLLLAPLSPGRHTLRFGGSVFVPDLMGSEYKYSQDVTYHLTIKR